MKRILVKDKMFTLYIKSGDIENTVNSLAVRLNEDLKGTTPLFLIILNGAFVFGAHLLKKISLDCEVSFVKLSSYRGTKSTSKVKELIGLDERLKGRSVVVLEDIIDTGITMDYLVEKLKDLGVADIRIVSLLVKPSALRKNLRIDYTGILIPNHFVIGYGMDYDGHGRQYPDIYRITKE
jgi:hypoxanthine phosphoribosyltransferase